jgi:hypothetical protein
MTSYARLTGRQIGISLQDHFQIESCTWKRQLQFIDPSGPETQGIPRKVSKLEEILNQRITIFSWLMTEIRDDDFEW